MSDANKITNKFGQQVADLVNFIVVAIFWFNFGFKVIPIVPGRKIPAVKWNTWLGGLSEEKIRQHWTEHPDHELGFIVGDEMIVFDADTPESLASLEIIENHHGIQPLLVVATAKGEHHYFRRAEDVVAKSDAHDSQEHPDRIDVKTGRALIVLPPSTGKSVKAKQADHATKLAGVTQLFVDSVFLMNGREVPRLPEPRDATDNHIPASLEHIGKILTFIDPDRGYDDWTKVLMSIFHETYGSQEGLELAIRWSSRGRKYKGRAEIETKWKSFRLDVARPCTLGTLIKLAREGGYKGNDEFEEEDFEVIQAGTVPKSESATADDGIVDLWPVPAAVPEPDPPPSSPLAKYTLQDRTAELEKMAVDQVPLLGNLAPMGQATVFYAAYNTGKTLITLSLLVDAIRRGTVDPSKVFYVNMDDHMTGLLEKNRLADEYRFHMLADGHREFSVPSFIDDILTMIKDDQAKGVVIILDTLKKFTNLMSKESSSKFAGLMRKFTLKGGTVVALAHTNKNPGPDGKPVYGGTNDIISDFDCGYILSIASEDKGQRFIEFENKKRRGFVAQVAAYRYTLEDRIEYHDLLLSVAEVDPADLKPLKEEAALKADEEVIKTVEACIVEGITTKMKLTDAVAVRAGVSRRAALKVIEKYCGHDDPCKNRWCYAVGNRGAKVFALLEDQPTPQDVVTL